MESILSFHHVDLGLDLTHCVRLRPADHGLELEISPGRTNSGTHDCQLPTQSPDLELQYPFEPHLSLNRIILAIRKLLSSDGQALRDLQKGLVIRKTVYSSDPLPLQVGNSVRNVSTYREKRLTASALIRPILLAKPVEKRLRPFQDEGVRWLIGRDKAILADDMGLGKTVQTIFALRILFNRASIHTVLIICPKSLLANWEEEITHWAPELSRLQVVPSPLIREEAWKAIWGRVHIILTNYEQVRHPPSVLLNEDIDLLVADEAHRIRNTDSQTTQGIRRLEVQKFWALTGTPIERDSEDLATLLSTLEPQRFSVSDKGLHPASLRSQARPYVLRRLKDEVLDDLPEVLESTQILDLLPGQRDSYLQVSRKLSDSNKVSTFTILNQLRAICDYDSRTGQSAKIDRIVEVIQDFSSIGDKGVVFSYLLEPLSVLEGKIRDALGRETVITLRGSQSLAEREDAIANFKSDKRIHVMLCSSRIAGEGLTLTEANHVIFLNEWWNPSANSQARDRVVRIGQRKGVRLYRYRCRNTIEETLEEILEKKSVNFEQLIDRLAETDTIS